MKKIFSCLLNVQNECKNRLQNSVTEGNLKTKDSISGKFVSVTILVLEFNFNFFGF